MKKSKNLYLINTFQKLKKFEEFSFQSQALLFSVQPPPALVVCNRLSDGEIELQGWQGESS